MLSWHRKAQVEPIVQPNHGFRKYFKRCLDKAELDEDKKRQLQGHSLRVEWSYTDRDIDELRPLYKRAYRYLDISEQGALNMKHDELQQEVRELRAVVRNLEIESSQRIYLSKPAKD